MPLRLLFILLMVACTMPRLAVSQERGETQATYLRAVGLDEHALALEKALLARLQIRRPFLDTARQQGIARYFAFVMTVSGFNAAMAEQLDTEGIDVIHAITADTRPFNEQALLSDLVVVGDVIAVEETLEPGDGFRSSIVVAVETVLKGEASADTLFIRQRSGLSPDDASENTSRDLFPEVGERYLFLLSNGMYRFFVATRDGPTDPLPEAVQAQHFLIYRSYQMDGGRLLWNRFSRRDTKRAFKEIRKLDELLAGF